MTKNILINFESIIPQILFVSAFIIVFALQHIPYGVHYHSLRDNILLMRRMGKSSLL